MVVFMLMVAPAVVVSLMLAVPAVIMLEAPTISVPVTVVVPAPFPTRSDPGCAAVRGKSPIAPVPKVAAVYHVPIAVNPHIAGARGYWPDAQHTRRRWSADCSLA